MCIYVTQYPFSMAIYFWKQKEKEYKLWYQQSTSTLNQNVHFHWQSFICKREIKRDQLHCSDWWIGKKIPSIKDHSEVVIVSIHVYIFKIDQLSHYFMQIYHSSPTSVFEHDVNHATAFYRLITSNNILSVVKKKFEWMNISYFSIPK